MPLASRALVGVKLEKAIWYFAGFSSSAGMMSEKVTLLMVQATPRTAQTSLASSTSHPSRLPVLGSTNSFGAYVASVAIWRGAAALTAEGTSAAMLAWTAGPEAAATLVGGLDPPEPPHAASRPATNRSAIPARRDGVTERPMSDPQSRELKRWAPLWTFAPTMSTDATTAHHLERARGGNSSQLTA